MSRTAGPIWARPEPGSRRPRFTREQIAAVALRIADTQGFDAVSMRRIASEVGAGTMTLYHYVRTKDELIALMDDAIMAEMLVPDDQLPEDWRSALTAIARSTRATLDRHSWALHSLQEASLGPNAMRHFEQSLAAIAGTPLDLHSKFALLAIVDDYVFGHALRAREVHARAATTEAEAEAARDFARSQLETGRFPHTEALATHWEQTSSSSLTTAEGCEALFDRGLEMLLDGAAARLGLPAERKEPTHPPQPTRLPEPTQPP
jgi:AcrR family transcriptional regulator